MSRCLTGWRIRYDPAADKWEAYNNDDGPRYERFPTWRRAFAFVEAETGGGPRWTTTELGLAYVTASEAVWST